MDSGLLNQLISQYSKEYGQLMDGEKPYIAEDRNRFFPTYPQQQSGLENWISSTLNPNGATTNAFTNKVGYGLDLLDAGQGKMGLETLLNASVHENYHARRGDVPMSGITALHNKSEEIFGGPKQYQKFLKDIRPEQLNSFPYNLQALIPFIGPRRMEEETIAYLLGKMATNHSKQSFKEATDKINPKIWQWFDMQTNGMEMLRNK